MERTISSIDRTWKVSFLLAGPAIYWYRIDKGIFFLILSVHSPCICHCTGSLPAMQFSNLSSKSGVLYEDRFRQVDFKGHLGQTP